MKFTGLLFIVLLFSISLLFGSYPSQKIDGMLPTYGAETGNMQESPPPIDSICLVFSGIDYGGSHSSPQNYVNAKHITNVIVGSYNFPVVTWETGGAWGSQSLFSYWDDMFKFWSYPDSFTTNGGQDTGRPAVLADSHGNLYFCWHQAGSPDGYETFFSRDYLDTSARIIQYSVERPAQFISVTNGDEETFPVMAMYGDTLIVVVFNVGSIGFEHAIHYNYSTDGGDTWAGVGTVYEHGATMPGSWELISIASDPNNGDMWATISFDYSGDGSMDMMAFHYNSTGATWDSIETVANATSMHAYCLPSLVVDYNGIPHIVFQENFGTAGGIGGLTVYPGCGPFGTLYYTHRQSGSWSSPMKIMLPRPPTGDFQCGHPSAGIAMDNTIHFSTTQPESTTSDTGAYSPFNVFYAGISPYTGAITYGDNVSKLPLGGTTNSIYAHTTYFVPLDGPGITWCQMDDAAMPADAYYCHKEVIVSVGETDDIAIPSPVMLYQNYPNPAREKTMIRFTVPKGVSISLDIYDISGRLLKTLAKGVPGAGSYFVVWDGKNEYGKEVPGGVYMYTLRAGSYTETRKMLLVH